MLKLFKMPDEKLGDNLLDYLQYFSHIDGFNFPFYKWLQL